MTFACRAVLLAVLMVAAGTSPARAAVVGDPALVGMAWEMSVPAPHYAVVHYEPCPGDSPFVRDCAFPDGRVFVGPLDPALETPLAIRMRLYHELGHVFASERPWVLRAFRRIMHVRSQRWQVSGEELFAAAYDNCARDTVPLKRQRPGEPEDWEPWPDEWNGNDGYLPYRRTHARVCRLIRKAF